MKIKCFVIDDENYAVDFLSRFIERTPDLQLVGSSTDAADSLDKILSGAIKADVIFLDIEMPKLNGMDFAALVSHLTKVVLVTGDPKFSLQAFELGAVDYLLKPVSYRRFEACIDRIKKLYSLPAAVQTPLSGKLAVRQGVLSEIVYVDIKDVIYVEASSNYCFIHTENQKSLKTLASLFEMEESLGKGCMRVHRSFIINLSKITRFYGNTIVLGRDTEIPLGRSYREDFLKVIKRGNS